MAGRWGVPLLVIALAACAAEPVSRDAARSGPAATAPAAAMAPAAAPAPAEALPPEYRRFAGRWTGIWNGSARETSTLIVDSITPNGEIRGTYAFMDLPPVVFRTRIVGDGFSFGRGARFDFTLRPDGRMSGERLVSGIVDTAVLARN